MRDRKNSDGRIIQSVERSIRALLLFLEHEGELGIKDFAEKLDLPKPTIHSIVNTLAVHQLLEQNPENSKYHLGPVLFRLGLQYIRQRDLLSTLTVWMERLSFKYRKTVNVCMLVGGKMVVVYKIDPEDAIIDYPNVGAAVSVHNTANGKVLLAFADPDVKERVLRDYPFEKATVHTITDRAAFEQDLAEVRNTGVGFNRQEGIMGVSAIAGPITNHNGQVIASFAISGDADFISENERQLVFDVKKTATAVSRQIGFAGAAPPS